jgi:hypothetical protein
VIALKVLGYPGGPLAPILGISGEIVYALHENEIYFTASKHGPSTINFAEQIITLICRQEEIDWKSYTFFDIQTTWGYPTSWRELDDFCIDRLHIDMNKEYPSVQGWETIVHSPGWYGMKTHYPQDLADSAPSWILETFGAFLLRGAL